jgi:hypothetical protein
VTKCKDVFFTPEPDPEKSKFLSAYQLDMKAAGRQHSAMAVLLE